MRKTRLISAALALVCASVGVTRLAACNNDYDVGFGVALILTADSSISDSALASARVLHVEVTGAESTDIDLTSPFKSGREERTIYRPVATSGALNFSALLYDMDGNAIGYGTGMAQLKSGATTTLRMTVSSMVPSQPDLAPPVGAPVITPATATIARGATQTFTADVPVTWSVVEAGGGTITGGGVFTPTLFGTYHVVATRQDNPAVSSTAQVTVTASTVAVLAGAVGGYGNADGANGISTRFSTLQGTPAVDANANVYVADRYNRTVRKITAGTGQTVTLAGDNYEAAGVVDGIGKAARFTDPYSVAFNNNILYITECNSHVIRKLDLATNAVTTLAGKPNNAAPSGTAGIDGADGASSLFNCPTGIYYDAAAPGGAALYVTEFGGFRVRRVNVTTGATVTVAGTGVAGNTDNPLTFSSLYGVVKYGNSLFVADGGNNSIRRIDNLTGALPITVGVTYSTGYVSPSGVGITGNTLVVLERSRVLTMAANGAPPVTAITTVAGVQNVNGYVDSANGSMARFGFPEGLVLANSTLAYVNDNNNYAVRTVNLTTGATGTLAGQPRQGGYAESVGSDGTTARFNRAFALAADKNNNVYVGDYNNGRIRKVAVSLSGTTANATVTTIVGGGAQNVVGPIPGNQVQLGGPHAVVFDGDHSLYIADNPRSAVRIVDLNTVDFQTRSVFVTEAVRSIAPLGDGTFYMTTNSNGVFFVDPTGPIVRRVYGRGSGAPEPPPPDMTGFVPPDLSGVTPPDLAGQPPPDMTMPPEIDGVGTAAYLALPTGIVLDDTKKFLYVADTAHNTLRRIELATGLVKTVAGLADLKGTNDGIGTMSRLNQPYHLTWAAGGVYIGDDANHLVRRYDPGTGMLSTIMGIPKQAGIQIGPAGALNQPLQVAFLPTGEMIINSDGEDVLVMAR